MMVGLDNLIGLYNLNDSMILYGIYNAQSELTSKSYCEIYIQPTYMIIMISTREIQTVSKELPKAALPYVSLHLFHSYSSFCLPSVFIVTASAWAGRLCHGSPPC